MSFIRILEQICEGSKKKVYVGSCIDGLKDPTFRKYVAEDATELAQVVEGGEEITREEFNKIALYTDDSGMPPKEDVDMAFAAGDTDDYLFFYNRDKDIAWIYDNLEDVEYFYV